MFMQCNCARQGEAVSLEILTDTIAATRLAAETAEPFVLVAYRMRAGGQNLAERRLPAARPNAGAGCQFRGAQRHCHARASEWESSDNRGPLN
jgi:hypothetical protein